MLSFEEIMTGVKKPKKVCAIVGVAYNAPEIVSVLSPWELAKNGCNDRFAGQLVPPHPHYDFQICFVSALFKQRWDRGEVYTPGKCEETLRKWEESGGIDKFIEVKEPIQDFQSRAIAWDFLKAGNPDLVWQLDGDEFYTWDEIHRVLEFVDKNPYVETFRINFKNYFGRKEDGTYVDDFKPLRIGRNTVNGGIKTWVWDNDFEWNSGKKSQEASILTIPRHLAFPRHLSWTGSAAIEKVDYQTRIFGEDGCSYEIDKERSCVKLNSRYYQKYGKPMPLVFKN